MPLPPVAMYGLEVSASGMPIPADPDFPATIRITMAAIDPDEAIETDGSRPRATLRVIRQTPEDDSDSDDEDDENMRALLADSDSDEDEDAANANGGPSDAAKSKKAKREAALKKLVESVDTADSDEEMEGVEKKKKGKGKASSDDEESDDESEGEDLDIEEFVICTLDPEKNYQQPLDITIGENEQVFFRVTGTHTVYLTGNYVMPDDDGHNHHHEVYDSDEDEDYDLSPDEDELELEMDDESDELDGLDDPRITELDSEEEEVPKTKADKKGKNKRAADEMANASLDDIIAKAVKADAAEEEEPKLSKKQQKKLKKNNGEAAEVKSEDAKAADANSSKKVQFAKNLEQGPTGSAEKPKAKADAKSKADASPSAKPALGVKTVNGVKIDDKKIGTGPACKSGKTVGMRYIGKLADGKVFDSNTKGKPFSFKLGAGEVIKGWDIGVAGMAVGGERRLIIPANLAYGSRSQPGIPGNSTLTFDVKLLEIK